jgi:XRE family transcriptional regulator, regulator of sulfur utilization
MAAADPLTRTLGNRVHEERRRLGVSLRELGAASGLSTTTVHQIESGRGSPSLATLQTLASALGVPLGALLESQGSETAAAILLPAGERPRASVPRGSLERLASGLPGQRVRGVLLTLAPGGDTGQDTMTHPGHELVFGLAGRCVYEVAGHEYWVGPGDSLVLDSRQPHRALNPGRGQAQLLLALYAAEESPAWLERHVRSSRAPRRVRSRRRP